MHIFIYIYIYTYSIYIYIIYIIIIIIAQLVQGERIVENHLVDGVLEPDITLRPGMSCQKGCILPRRRRCHKTTTEPHRSRLVPDAH